MVDTRKAQRFVIYTQVVGAPILVLLQGPFMITYLSRLGLSSARVLDMLALLALVRTLIQPPLAYVGDRHGKKKLGYIGCSAVVLSMLGMGSLPGIPEDLRMVLLVCSILVYGLGGGLLGSVWFGLLAPLIHPEERGRFFARLRMSWQFSSIILVAGVSWLLDRHSALSTYQIIFSAGFLLACLRLVFFYRIPEVEPPTRSEASLWKSLLSLLEDARLRSFCSYAFLLSAAAAPLQFLFALLMKDVAEFSEGRIVLAGNLTGVGAMMGFYVGGRMVDKLGTKSVFISAHLGYALLFAVTPLYALPGWPAFPHFASLCFLGGLISSASGIAMSSTVIGLSDGGAQRSLTTALTNACIQLAPPVTLFLISRVLELGLLAESWSLGGVALGPYDALSFFAAVAVFLLLITLGLVPYSLHKPRPLPREGSSG